MGNKLNELLNVLEQNQIHIVKSVSDYPTNFCIELDSFDELIKYSIMNNIHFAFITKQQNDFDVNESDDYILDEDDDNPTIEQYSPVYKAKLIKIDEEILQLTEKRVDNDVIFIMHNGFILSFLVDNTNELLEQKIKKNLERKNEIITYAENELNERYEKEKKIYKFFTVNFKKIYMES